jgi:hypothetical protein
MSVRAAKRRGTWAQKVILNSFSIVIFQANHMYTFRFEANAQLVRLQLRSRNAVEGPERSRAVVERAKQQWRYFLFLHNARSLVWDVLWMYIYIHICMYLSVCVYSCYVLRENMLSDYLMRDQCYIVRDSLCLLYCVLSALGFFNLLMLY